MNRIQKIFAGTAGALAIVAVTTVVAAPYGAMGTFMGGSGMGGHGMGGYGMGTGGMGMMQGGQAGVMSAQYLDQMKARLAITAQQEPAWKAFSEKASAQAALMEAMHLQHHQAVDANTPVPDQMAQRTALMSQHLAGMQGMSAALKDLYGVLTPQQRSIADQMFGGMGGHGPGYGRGMRG